ncbi:MAG: hypothetical protein E7270_02120 [Lachnospiraceae bacterium]|nr:hypothetical protein [Lachnospiraceae bacterium]
MEIISSVREELERLGKDAGDAGKIAAANAKDIMSNMFRDLADENAAAADAAVQAWENAFNRIAELRKKILSGENIQDDIFG